VFVYQLVQCLLSYSFLSHSHAYFSSPIIHFVSPCDPHRHHLYLICRNQSTSDTCHVLISFVLAYISFLSIYSAASSPYERAVITILDHLNLLFPARFPPHHPLAIPSRQRILSCLPAISSISSLPTRFFHECHNTATTSRKSSSS
jgi:hypothetical protein